MPKAKFKRKGVPAHLTGSLPPPPKRSRTRSEGLAAGGTNNAAASGANDGEISANFAMASFSSPSSCSILHLPEEVICLIVEGLDVSSLAALEAACTHLRKMIVNARLWRRIFMSKMEQEPGLQVQDYCIELPDFSVRM